jgi:hypothetical protein
MYRWLSVFIISLNYRPNFLVHKHALFYFSLRIRNKIEAKHNKKRVSVHSIFKANNEEKRKNGAIFFANKAKIGAFLNSVFLLILLC